MSEGPQSRTSNGREKVSPLDDIATAKRWPINRTWTVVASSGSRNQLSTSELTAFRACGLLGSAGLGKTYELKYLSALESEAGLDVRFERLAVLGQTPDGLASHLQALASAATQGSVIYLDALDEVMVPVKVAALVVERWIRDHLSANRPALRISCRSAVWSADVLTALEDVYGKDSCAVFALDSISEGDVKHVAAAYGVNADAFQDSVHKAGVQTLAQQPLTLRMLLRLYQRGGALPTNRGELFAKGVEELAIERAERRESGTAVEFAADVVVEAAERLACILLLSGRDAVDLSDSPSSSSLGVVELAGLPSVGPKLNDELLRAVARSGLCDSDGPRRFRFAHRQFAEYLAGRRLAKLLFHQSRALISSGLGWQSGVAGPLREMAAFAAMHSAPIAAWVAEHDPEVLGRSDVADDDLRRRATLNLLEKFRRHELTDAQIIRGGVEFGGYHYAGIEGELRPVLRERYDGCEDVLECAIKLVVQGKLVSMSDDLADLMLDETAPLESRKAAGYALMQMGATAAKRRLRSLITEHRDPELDLKGLALRCNWPGELTVPELLAATVTQSNSRYGGAYGHFLYELERTGFNAQGHRLDGLLWAAKFLSGDSDIEPQGRISRRIAIAAVDELEEPGVAEALADMLLAAARNHAGSPLTLPSRGNKSENQPEEPRLHENVTARRRLVDALTARADDDSVMWWVAHETPNLALPKDFPWLLERATTDALPMPQRKKYAELTRTIRWDNSVENVEAWLAARTIEPVASRFPTETYMDLKSEEAARARKMYAEANRKIRQPRRKKYDRRPRNGWSKP